MDGLASIPKPLDLARLWLDHADRQGTCLAHLLKGLRDLQATLSQGRWSDYADQLARLEPLLKENDDLQAARTSLRKQMEASTPRAGMTLETLASLIPPAEAQRLRGSKSRLRALAEQLQHQARSTHILARHHLDFFEGFFSDLTQPAGAAPCYGPAGQLRTSAPSSLIQVRG